MSNNPYESVNMQPKPQETVSYKNFQIGYLRNFSFLFESSNGIVNLLLCTAIQIIPVIGPIVLLGYQYEISETLIRQGGGVYPDFSFDRFSYYLSRGVWPFLVALVVGLLMVPISLLLVFGLMFSFAAAGTNSSPAIGVTVIIAMILVSLGAGLVLNLILIPFSIRAGLGQDFGKSFNFGFVRQFIGLVWMELILGFLVIALVAPIVLLAGLLVFIVGYIVAITLIGMAVGFHNHQLYCLYLSRGGMPIPFKAVN